MHHAPLGCRFAPRGYHNVQERAARVAMEVGTETRLAEMVEVGTGTRLAEMVEVGTESWVAEMVAVVLAQLPVVAKVATKAAVGKVGKVACLAVFQEILHCRFLHKVCDTRQMLGVSECCADTGSGYADQGSYMLSMRRATISSGLS